MAKDFNYTGKPNTCHWCGRRIPEYTSEVGRYHATIRRFQSNLDPLPDPPAVGSEFEGHKVGRVVPMGEGNRIARDGDTVRWYRIHFDPPRFQGHYSSPDRGGTAIPAFDTLTCGLLFACRVVGTGKILRGNA